MSQSLFPLNLGTTVKEDIADFTFDLAKLDPLTFDLAKLDPLTFDLAKLK